MSQQHFRKGTPIESPHSRKGRRLGSSHDNLSPLNTLESTNDSIRGSKSSTVKFPLKLENMPSSYKRSLALSSTDSDISGKDDFKSKPTSPKPRQSNENVNEHYSPFKTFSSRSSLASPSAVASSGFKALKISHIQYRLVIIPPSRTIHSYEDMKLLFYPTERLMVLSAKINGESASTIAVPFSKIERVQFVRKTGECSSDWTIDFVFVYGFKLDFSKFKHFDDPEIVYNGMTLRVDLARNCGMSIESIENILLSIVRNRNAFHFTEIRDSYGEFEDKLDFSNSPPKSQKTSPKSTAMRIVPSLEKLSSSASVQNSRFSKSLPASPDVFDLPPRRTSKRLKSTNSPKEERETSFTYVDPDFESDRVKLFCYPEGEVESIQVTSHELERLEPGIWLNDTLIEFELKYLLHQLDPKIQETIHIFNSFFYRRLSSAKMTASSNEKSGFDLVKSWTRKVNLFEKDFVIVPINENLHWFLAIICHPSRILSDLDIDEKTTLDDGSDSDDINVVDLSDETARILIFDSLGLTTRGKSSAVINRLRTYLQMEAEDKLKRSALKSKCTGHVVKVPQQENYTDCGCFVLQFVEEFFKGIPLGIVENIVNLSFDLSNWFPSAIGQSRRQIMKERIKLLAEDYAIRNEHKSSEASESNSSDIEEIEMFVK